MNDFNPLILPHELWRVIFNFLNISSRFQILYTCKYFSTLNKYIPEIDFRNHKQFNHDQMIIRCDESCVFVPLFVRHLEIVTHDHKVYGFYRTRKNYLSFAARSWDVNVIDFKIPKYIQSIRIQADVLACTSCVTLYCHQLIDLWYGKPYILNVQTFVFKKDEDAHTWRLTLNIHLIVRKEIHVRDIPIMCSN